MSDEEKQEELAMSANPAAEIVARLAVSLGLNIARVMLHSRSPVQAAHEQNQEDLLTGYNIAEMTESMFTFANNALRTVGLAQDDNIITGQTLGTIVRLLTQFTGPVVGVSGTELFDGVKAYLYAQTITRPVEVVPEDAPKPNIPELNRYMRFIVATYGAVGVKFMGIVPMTAHKVWGSSAAIKYLTGIDTDDCLIDHNWRSNWTGKIYHPGYYILLDHEHKEIIVGVRGSFRFQDAITDLMCEDEEFKFVYHKDHDQEMSRMLSAGANSYKPVEEDDEEAFFNHLLTNGQGGGNLRTRIEETTTGAIRLLQTWVSSQHVTSMGGESTFESTFEEPIPTGRLDSTPHDHRKVMGRTHKGFGIAAANLSKEIEPTVLQALKDNKGYNVVVCGHSLGAAVAVLLTLMWARIPELASTRCYTVAQPCTVSEGIAESKLAMKRIVSIAMPDDIVTRLSYWTVQDMRDSILRLAKDDAPPEEDDKGTNINEGMSLAQWIIQCAQTKTRSECKALFQPVMDTLRKEEMTSEKLYPAGKIWHVIDPEKGINGGAVIRAPTAFSEIQLSNTMFIHHVPNHYAHACDPIVPLRSKHEAAKDFNEAIASEVKVLSKRSKT